MTSLLLALLLAATGPDGPHYDDGFSCLPLSGGTVTGEVSLNEGFEATGDYDTVCSSASVRGDIDGVQSCGPLTDVAPATLNINAPAAAPLGAGSTTGANIVMRPGPGTHKAVLTAASFVNNTTTFTVTVDGTANTGTEGTAFECDSVTDTVCANNVANYYEALAGAAGVHACSSGSTTTCTAFGFTGVAGTVYFFPAPEDSPGKFIDSIACSTGAAAVLTNGTNGQSVAGGPWSATSPVLAVLGDTDTGLTHAAANTIGLAAGATSVLSSTATLMTIPIAVTLTGAVSIPDGASGSPPRLTLGTSSDVLVQYDTTQTPDAFKIGVGSDSRCFLIYDQATGFGTDWACALQTNPTVRIQSASTTAALHLTLAHNQTDAVIGVGSGDLGIQDDGGKGVKTYIRTNTEVLTFAANPGDATKVTSALCPVGVPIMGVTTRVRTTATNCTSVQIGDGTDADMFSSATSDITAGTTTGPANYTAYSRIGIGQAAFNVTVTANGGNCFAGVWAVTCHYIDPVAATAN